jgi:cell division protein FtsL
MITDKPTFISYLTNGSVALIGMFNFEFMIMIIGLVLAAVTCATNVYHKRRQDKRDVAKAIREAEYHQLRMRDHACEQTPDLNEKD